MRMLLVSIMAILAGAVALAQESADELKSGPQVGATLPGPLQALTVLHADNADVAGKKSDYVEEYGQNPVVLVLARMDSDALRKLLERVDAEVARYKMDKKKVRALLVLLSDDDDLENNLKDLAAKHGIKHVSLSTDSAAGASKWKIANDADVTVILYRRRKVEANNAFRKGELNEKAIGTVIADLPKIVGK